jgi:hypothetical protein
MSSPSFLAGGRAPPGVLLNELEDIEGVNRPIGKEAVHRILLIQEDFEHALELHEYEQLHMNAVEFQQLEPTSGTS